MALFCGILGNVIWGFSFLLIRTAQQASSPEILLSVRFLLAWILLSIPLLTGKRKFQLRGKKLLPLFLLGVLEPCYYLCESYGIYYTNSTFAGMILAVVPVVSIGASILFLKEYPTRRQALFCILPVLGVIMITVSGKSLGVVNGRGIFFLICTCLASVGYKTANRKSSAEFTAYERTYVMMMFCAIVSTITAAIQEGSISAYLNACQNALIQPQFLWSVIGLCLMGSIAANMLVNYAAASLSVTQMSTLGSLVTLIALFAGILILHEPYSAVFFLGAAFILIGTWQVTRPEPERSVSPSDSDSELNIAEK